MSTALSIVSVEVEPSMSYASSAGADLSIGEAWSRRVEELRNIVVIAIPRPYWIPPRGSDPLRRLLFDKANKALSEGCSIEKASEVIAARELSLAYGANAVRRAVEAYQRKHNEKRLAFERSNRGPKPNDTRATAPRSNRKRPGPKLRFTVVHAGL